METPDSARMSTAPPVAPYRILKTVEGSEFPYCILPYDADGACRAPRTLEFVVEQAKNHSDVFVFCHGWNNDWSMAVRRYEGFIEGVQEMRRERSLPAPKGFRPLLIGIFWPSQALEWFESETGPSIAGDPAMQAVLADVAADLPERDHARFFELARSAGLNADQGNELAHVLSQLLEPDDEGLRSDPPDAEELLAAASSLSRDETDYEAVYEIAKSGPLASLEDGPTPALGLLDPRSLLKPFTVWRMKDRAGKVGAMGVSELLVALLADSDAHVHLVGHSYGCKVMMTGLCRPAAICRNAASALLLQPAVSQYAFSQSVPGRNTPGGFVKALTRVNLPILSTFSERDIPLTTLFHLAVRRHDDLGELQFSARGAPSLYGALGGFGPPASQARVVDIQPIGQPYELLDNPGRLIGLRGNAVISGHGDVSCIETWWALYCLFTAGRNLRMEGVVASG